MAASGQQGAMCGMVLGGFRLVELIGVGGMAEVYRGLDSNRAAVAVKVLPAELASDPGYVLRFRVEAKRAAALSHPNIVPVFHFGEEQNILFLVMPLLRTSLREQLDRAGAYECSEAIRIALDVAAGLDAAHNFGIMHRDVKPENILLDTSGKALLTDFGIARDLDMMGGASSAQTLSITGLPVGTPEYMAPEQLNRAPFDQRIDIYSLGVVLYEMLTGVVPHDASTPMAVVTRVLHEKVRPPSMYRPTIWPALDRTVLTAMANDPNDRYPNMASFAAGLRWAHEQRERAGASVGVSALAPRRRVAGSVPSIAAEPPFAPQAAISALDRHTIDRHPTQPMPLTGGWSAVRGWQAPLEWLRTTPRSPLLLGLLAVLALVLLALCGWVAALVVQALTAVPTPLG